MNANQNQIFENTAGTYIVTATQTGDRTMASHDWFTTVGFGGNPAPTGPWHGEDAAGEALDRWAARTRWQAGTLQAAHSIRIVGPFCTREAARRTDISDYLDEVCRCDMEA